MKTFHSVQNSSWRHHHQNKLDSMIFQVFTNAILGFGVLRELIWLHIQPKIALSGLWTSSCGDFMRNFLSASLVWKVLSKSPEKWICWKGKHLKNRSGKKEWTNLKYGYGKRREQLGWEQGTRNEGIWEFLVLDLLLWEVTFGTADSAIQDITS